MALSHYCFFECMLLRPFFILLTVICHHSLSLFPNNGPLLLTVQYVGLCYALVFMNQLVSLHFVLLLMHVMDWESEVQRGQEFIQGDKIIKELSWIQT